MYKNRLNYFNLLRNNLIAFIVCIFIFIYFKNTLYTLDNTFLITGLTVIPSYYIFFNTKEYFTERSLLFITFDHEKILTLHEVLSICNILNVEDFDKNEQLLYKDFWYKNTFQIKDEDLKISLAKWKSSKLITNKLNLLENLIKSIMNEFNLSNIRLIISNNGHKKNYQQVINKQINIAEFNDVLHDFTIKSKSFTSAIIDIK